MKCTACQTPGAYVGMNEVECVNASCRHFKAPAVSAADIKSAPFRGADSFSNDLAVNADGSLKISHDLECVIQALRARLLAPVRVIDPIPMVDTRPEWLCEQSRYWFAKMRTVSEEARCAAFFYRPIYGMNL